MIQLSQLKLPVEHSEQELQDKIIKELRIRREDLKRFRILKRSIDAREKPKLYYVYSLAAEISGEKKVLGNPRIRNVSAYREPKYQFPDPGSRSLKHRPVIIGSGPAGLFCAWILAKKGYRPILLERGEKASERQKTVAHFWNTGLLDTESNVQFGEGGAGTFSDGKLNTGVKDKFGRNHEVLRILVQAGAPEKILYDAKPHLGTDLLVQIVEKLREQIISWGGSVYFRTKVTGLLTDSDQITGVKTEDGRVFLSETVVLAIGHSARDTFAMLSGAGIEMQQKSFAVGVRVEHPQSMINEKMYGTADPGNLGAAPYKLTRTLGNGRGVYSFCMCPGGYVVNASSEKEMLAVNGMSYHDRASAHANSAIIVTVTPEDYAAYAQEGISPVLNGMLFQRHLEKMAYRTGEGCIPVQRFEDFQKNRAGGPGLYEPVNKGMYRYANVREIFPASLAASLDEGIVGFDRSIHGYSDPEAILSGVESRTSSPVRIVRDEHLQSNLRGLYPCGEGAGYAGGITSAAMDGLKVAEAIAMEYNFMLL
ncbi:MAG: NAD(P)-binding protein [Eubacteriales bacterium]|nr:NAD(P)-binding protein [Eubacteriales bacterium]